MSNLLRHLISFLTKSKIEESFLFIVIRWLNYITVFFFWPVLKISFFVKGYSKIGRKCIKMSGNYDPTIHYTKSFINSDAGHRSRNGNPRNRTSAANKSAKFPFQWRPACHFKSFESLYNMLGPKINRPLAWPTLRVQRIRIFFGATLLIFAADQRTQNNLSDGWAKTVGYPERVFTHLPRLFKLACKETCLSIVYIFLTLKK